MAKHAVKAGSTARDAKKLTITLRKSPIGFNRNQRAVVEAAGVANILTKSLGSANPHNVVRATFAGLGSLQDPALMARLRGKELGELVKSA